MARTAEAGTRERILEVASALFYEHGVRAVGMSQIIDAAGCGKNLLYGHYPSKTALVAGYLERFRDELERATDAAVEAAGPDPADRVLALVAELAGRVDRQVFRGCPFRNYLTEFRDGDAAPDRIARAYLHDGRARLHQLVEQLPVTDPDGVTDRLVLVLDALYASAAHPRGERNGAAAVALAREIIGRG
jgi:AcrR family transcriptional regulator